MVLEGATADDFSSRTASDTPPASDSDAYSSRVARIADANVQIDLRQLPRPLPILGPLTGFSEAALVDRFTRNIAQLSGAVNRPLTAAECQSVAYYAAKANAIASYGFPLGAAGGLYREYATRATFKFPFFQPDMQVFTPQKMGPLSGARAEMAWHLLRRMSYGFFGGAVGTVIVGTYAAATAAAGQRVDPRMADVVEALKGMSPTELRNKARSASPAQRARQADQLARQDGAQGDDQAFRRYDDVDDASPTGSDSGVLGDAQMRSQETRQERADSRRVASSMESATVEDTASDVFEDASPTAGNGQLGQSHSTAAAAGGSAWERLRRANTPAQDGSPRTRPGQGQAPAQSQSQMASNAWADRRGAASVLDEQRRGATVGDGYTFSRTEEERALAKGEAQREFDAKVDKERRGESFDGESRWR